MKTTVFLHIPLFVGIRQGCLRVKKSKSLVIFDGLPSILLQK